MTLTSAMVAVLMQTAPKNKARVMQKNKSTDSKLKDMLDAAEQKKEDKQK